MEGRDAEPSNGASSPPTSLLLTPDETLTFTWTREKDLPKATLSAYNSSNNTVLTFKVKTTAPKRYHVRPPHGFVRPGETASILLSMAARDTASLWWDAVDSKGEQIKTEDKFQVQFAVVPESFASQFLQGDVDEKEVMKSIQNLWKELGELDKAQQKKRITSKRLTTKFEFPMNLSSTVAPRNLPAPAGAGHGSVASPTPAADLAARANKDHVPGSPEAIFSELTALRRKYDDLVAYTVVLSGERDFLNQELEEVQGKLQKEVGKRQHAADGEERPAASRESTEVKQKEPTVGFSFVQVLVVGLVAFIFGRVFS